MKEIELRLALVRHAQSSAARRGDDRDRPLSARGRQDAARLGRRVFGLGWLPDAILTSDARRARETWERMAAGFGGVRIPVFHCPDLYLAGVDEIRVVAEVLSVRCRTLLLVGHNPGLSEALAELAGVSRSMRPADAALLEGRGRSWAEALCERWTLASYLSIQRPDARKTSDAER